MGKRKASSRKPAKPVVVDRTPRKEPYGSSRLTAVVDRIREQAVRISALARAMEDAGVSEIYVDGHAMLIRGMNQIDNFVDNASRAVREEKTALEQI